MPRRKRTARAVVVPIESEEETDAPSQEERDAEESNAAAERALGTVESKTVVKIFRLDQRTGREGYLDTIDADVFSQEFVKNTYGGGDYRVMARGPTGNGRIKGYKGSETFTIDKSIPSKYPKSPEDMASLTSPVQSGPAPEPRREGQAPMSVMDTATLSFLQMMQQQNQQFSTMTMAMMERLAKPVESPLLVALAPSIPAIVERLLGGKSPVDPIEQATRIAEISSKAAAKSSLSEVTAVMDLVDRVRDRSNGDNGGEGRGFWGMIASEGVRLLRDARAADASRAAATGQNPPDVAPVPQAANGAEPAALPEPSHEEPNDVHYQILQRVLPDLISAARKGRNAEQTAEWIEQDIQNEGERLAVRPFLDSVNFTPQLCRSITELRGYEAWVERVRVSLVALLADDDIEDEDDDEPEPEPKPRTRKARDKPNESPPTPPM